MMVIGLTGGIGTGKSEAARYLTSLGAALIDADQVGHEAYRPHAEAWQRVVQTFGPNILQPDNQIDRPALAAIVFADPDQLAQLNAIMHPLMAKMVQTKITALQTQGAPVIIVEAALLYEAGWDSLVHEVWVTDAPETAVIRRLAQRNGLTETEARKRLDSQMSRPERLNRADAIIDNSQDLPALHQAINGLWAARVQKRIEQT